MAKSTETKRQEALQRLEKRLEDQQHQGVNPSKSQLTELNALRYPKRAKSEAEKFSERLFGVGDPVTGVIWADPLPWNYQPTPELETIVAMLKQCTERFVEVQVNLEVPQGHRFATYAGSGAHMDQWIQRHTSYLLHHSKHLYGVHIVVVFAKAGLLPEYDEDDRQIGGITQTQYEKGYR